ncbi:MAG: efflux RND transporter periplasmic adaptor subunit [Anaerolineae bacterium]
MKRFLAIILVVVMLAASWLLYNRNAPQPEAPAGYETEAVRRGSIDAVVSATGSLAAERTQPLVSASAGAIAEVLVAEGDRVEAGQVLARMDAADLALNVRQAEAAVRVAEASLGRAQLGASEAEIAAAEAAVAAAQASLVDLQRGPSERDLELARLAIDQAKNSLWAAQGNRDNIQGNPVASQGAKDNAEAQVLNAELAVTIAELQYAQLQEPTSASALRAAESQLATAQSSLDRLRTAPSDRDIAVAQAQLDQAKVGLDIAREQQANAEITAPFAGVLATWILHPQDVLTPATSFGTLIDDKVYHIDVDIDETEISAVQVGQQVAVTLDAFPDESFEGRVAGIESVGNNAQGIVTYGVRIELSPTDLPVRPLMTSAVTIVVAQKDDVLLVPNRAIRRDQEGTYVEVLEGATPERVSVQIGLANEQVTEIVSGIEEGQPVVVVRPRASLLDAGLGN